MVPTLFDSRECQLHRADMRDDFKVILAERLSQESGDPVEQWVAASQHHGGAVSQIGDGCFKLVQIRGDGDFFGR